MGPRHYADLVLNFGIGFFSVLGFHALAHLRSVRYEADPDSADAPPAGQEA